MRLEINAPIPTIISDLLLASSGIRRGRKKGQTPFSSQDSLSAWCTRVILFPLFHLVADV